MWMPGQVNHLVDLEITLFGIYSKKKVGVAEEVPSLVAVPPPQSQICIPHSVRQNPCGTRTYPSQQADYPPSTLAWLQGLANPTPPLHQADDASMPSKHAPCPPNVFLDNMVFSTSAHTQLGHPYTCPAQRKEEKFEEADINKWIDPSGIVFSGHIQNPTFNSKNLNVYTKQFIE